jgi:hypothetical protein
MMYVNVSETTTGQHPKQQNVKQTVSYHRCVIHSGFDTTQVTSVRHPLPLVINHPNELWNLQDP